MGRSYYDDNFGFYEIRDQEDIEFYKEMQRKSVWKKCESCGRRVKLKSDYGICNSCADRMERGYDMG